MADNENEMRELGTVVDVEDGVARVMFKRTSACGHCTACGLLKDMSEIIVDVDDTLAVRKGQKIEVRFSTQTTLKSAALAYGIPLITLLLGLPVGYFIAKSTGWNPDATAAVTALVFTGIGFLILKLLEPRFKKTSASVYRMTRIVDFSTDGDDRKAEA